MRREVEASLLHDLGAMWTCRSMLAKAVPCLQKLARVSAAKAVLSSPPLPRSHVVRVQCEGESAIVRGEMAACRSCMDDHEAAVLELDCVTLELQGKLGEVSESLLELGVTVLSMVNRLWNISDHGIKGLSMVTDVVVDRVGNVEGWNSPNNCLPFGVRHAQFLSEFLPMLARCNGLQNLIVLEEQAASIVSSQ